MTRAIVVGGGLAGLRAADVLVNAGIDVTLIEERGRCGGLVAPAEFTGIAADIGAESFAVRATELVDLCHELGLEVTSPQGSSWVWSHEGGGHAVPIPFGMLGMAANWDDPDLALALTAEELDRARQDLTMGSEAWADDLAGLVEARFGTAVLDKLTRPIAAGIYGSDPANLAVDTVCPGLRQAFAEVGSVTGAVAKLKQGQPRHSVLAPVGGMFRLPAALQQRIEAAGGRVLTRTRVTSAEKTESGWRVVATNTTRGANKSAAPVSVGEPFELESELLVWATSGNFALEFLRGLPGVDVADWTLPEGAPVVHVSFEVDNPALDAGPRGSGMLVAAPTADTDVQAKALTHYSYKWPWCGQELGPGRHLLRVSYGRAGQAEPQPSLAQALADASRLLGVELAESNVHDAMVIHWGRSLPPHTLAHRERLAQLRDSLVSHPDFALVGAWCTGSGLAAVIPGATKEAKQLLERNGAAS